LSAAPFSVLLPHEATAIIRALAKITFFISLF
jgi:hypothetical protein